MIRLDEDGNGHPVRPRRGNHTPAGASPRRSFQPTISRRGKPIVASPRRLRYHSYERVKAAATDPRSGRCLYSDSPDGNGVDPNPEFKTATMSDYTVANVRALARVGQTPPNRISYPCRYPRRNRLRGCLVLVFLAETRLEGSRRNLSSVLAETRRGTAVTRRLTVFAETRSKGPHLRGCLVLVFLAETRSKDRGYPSINRLRRNPSPMLEGPRLDFGHCPSRNYSQLRRRNTRD